MFIPKRIIFEKNSLDYEIGQKVYNKFKDNSKIEIVKLSSNKIKQSIPGEDLRKFYMEGKNTLVVGVKKGSKFQSCKPSAHYQLPLVSGCIGHCEYCYLNTNLGDKPYIKINVNFDDIIELAQNNINERLPEITIFEGSATSDPVPVEPYSNLLGKSIEFFGKSKYGRFRFVTKYNDIDSLLNIQHNGHTEIRFTINTDTVINSYEKRTAAIDKRIEASVNVAKAGYPVGYIIAPVFIYEGWKEDYRKLLIGLHDKLPEQLFYPLTFEVISHRYTTRAKNIITEVFPQTTLPMNDADRKYKYGQFGYAKFVYPKQEIDEIKQFFSIEIRNIFVNADVKYII